MPDRGRGQTRVRTIPLVTWEGRLKNALLKWEQMSLDRRIIIGCYLALLVGHTDIRAADFGERQQDFFRSNCFDCHQGTGSEGGLDLAALSWDLNDDETLRRWVRIYDRVAAGEMPPPEAARPQEPVRRAFLASLGVSLSVADRGQREVVLRRLNRAEYENTIRDLFHTRAEVAAMLPEDAQANGFDNIGEALAVSTELIEAYLRAADVAIDAVLAQEQPSQIEWYSTFNEGFKTRSNAKQVFRFVDEGVVHYLSDLNSTHVRNFTAHATGTYRIRFRARAYHSQQPITVEVGAGDVFQGNRGRHLIGYFDVQPEMTEIVFEDWLRSGDGFSVRPFGIGNVRIGQNRNYAGPGVLFADYDVMGPIEDDLTTGLRELLGSVDMQRASASDARDIMARFLPRAFRRPATTREINRYVGYVHQLLDDGESFESALRAGLRAVLCAPEFLFLNEPLSPGRNRIDDYAIASRLSYFLWSTMPDSELLELAARGRISDPIVRQRQVERMLADPKAAAFTGNFTGQWLNLRQLAENEPDQMLYPEYDALLEYSMGEETRRVFDRILRDNLSVMEFVDSDWSILNERLAEHYGIPGVTGSHFRQVSLPSNSPRGGVMTQASILKVTANGTTTSPVIRGAWVLDNVLGIPVPPPPPVPAVEPDLTGATTLRQQLDQHRSDISCAACHSKMDPPGFALESFDAIGGQRERYRIPTGEDLVLDPKHKDQWPITYRLGLPVDSTGHLPTGEPFQDIRELKELLSREPERMVRGLSEKLLTYALGRGLGFSDREIVESIVAQARNHNYGFRSLVQQITASEVFIQP